MNLIEINPSEDLIFDLKVVESCKNCKRYGTKASCPPYVFDSYYYQKLLPTYRYGVVYYEQFNSLSNTWVENGKNSSLALQKFLLARRDELFQQGRVFVTAFGSGSCKLCTECSFPCRLPNKALVPLEATGLDVVKTVKKFGVNIKFPVTDSFYRIGAIFYD
jgi:predicted metal-binding protein